MGMNRKKRLLLGSCVCFVLVAGCAANEQELHYRELSEQEFSEKDAQHEEENHATEESANEKSNQQPVIENDGNTTTINGIVVVNKKYGVPADYAPGEDPTASAALHQLIADMQSLGLDISQDYSGFRSYETQADLYSSYVNAYGQEQADTFSARPGYSEHQTGLAYDLKHTNGMLVENETEAQWLLDHADEYGFIVRYQEGKEAITGYVAEPWHIRYIGEEATDIKNSGLCLEEYLHIE